MANYRRNFQSGGSYFCTVSLADRRLTLLNDHIDLLRTAVRQVRARHPFTSHILEKKSPKRKRALSRPTVLSKHDAPRVKRLLGEGK